MVYVVRNFWYYRMAFPMYFRFYEARIVQFSVILVRGSSWNTENEAQLMFTGNDRTYTPAVHVDDGVCVLDLED